jgi:hypothetical protein
VEESYSEGTVISDWDLKSAMRHGSEVWRMGIRALYLTLGSANMVTGSFILSYRHSKTFNI